MSFENNEGLFATDVNLLRVNTGSTGDSKLMQSSYI